MRSQFVEEKHRISCGSLEVRLILVLAVARVNMCFSSFWYKSCSCAVVFSRGWGSFPCKLVCIQNLQVIILQNKSIDWIFQSRYWVDVEKKSYSIMFQLEVAMSFVIPLHYMVVGDFEAVHFAAASPDIQDLCRFQRRKIAIVGARDSCWPRACVLHWPPKSSIYLHLPLCKKWLLLRIWWSFMNHSIFFGKKHWRESDG